MSRCLRLLALLLAVCGVAALAADKQTEQTKGSHTVYYRNEGDKDWLLFGYYEDKESAESVIAHLESSGHEVKLAITNTPIPDFPDPQAFARKPGVNAKLPIEETVTLERANQIFYLMSRQNDLAFRFPTDGCYARAELMVERMTKMGLKPRKVWTFANGKALRAETKNHPQGYVTWGYHVAPALRVRDDNNEQRWYVIDPSLFSSAATLTAWMNAQRNPLAHHRPFMTITKPGEAPIGVDKKRRPGSGYWPGSDPKEGIRSHAIATMKKYKPYEGKEPPRKFETIK